MDRLKVTILVTAAIMLGGMLTSCSTVRQVAMATEYQEQFLGFDEAYIMAACGQPTTTFPDGKGGRVLEYDDMAEFSLKTGIALSKVEAGDYGARPYVQFFMGQDGACYSVRTNHVRTVKEYDNQKSWLAAGCSMGGTAVAVSVVALVFGLIGGK